MPKEITLTQYQAEEILKLLKIEAEATGRAFYWGLINNLSEQLKPYQNANNTIQPPAVGKKAH